MKRRWPSLLVLMLAGEAVFLLPFVVPRVFRPTLLDVFGLSNLQLGTAFSAYGIVAMVSYLLGGPLADRYPPRRLICLALLFTAGGGLVFAAIPGPSVLIGLYAFWGMSTILLFWAPLMRATREWGGEHAQGAAFGFLDGGRGLLAALIASLAVGVFAWLLPGELSINADANQRQALQQIVLLCGGFTVMVSLLVWRVLPTSQARAKGDPRLNWQALLQLLRWPVIWLQSLVILCAYLAYKLIDYFSLFARDVLHYDEVSAAQLGAVVFWMRPLAAVGAGLLADRIAPTRVLILGFALLSGACFLLSLWPPSLGLPALLLLNLLVAALGVYAVRGVYYAVMGEVRVPAAVTGSAVGLVSVVGFTPDIFAGPLFGYLLDRSPGLEGHQQLFLLVAITGLAGSVLSLGLRLRASRAPLR